AKSQNFPLARRHLPVQGGISTDTACQVADLRCERIFIPRWPLAAAEERSRIGSRHAVLLRGSSEFEQWDSRARATRCAGEGPSMAKWQRQYCDVTIITLLTGRFREGLMYSRRALNADASPSENLRSIH